MEYELKLATGQVVVWDGKDGVDAAWRYARSHPGAVVLAWRTPRVGLYIGVDPDRIIEPGDPRWGRSPTPT